MNLICVYLSVRARGAARCDHAVSLSHFFTMFSTVDFSLGAWTVCSWGTPVEPYCTIEPLTMDAYQCLLKAKKRESFPLDSIELSFAFLQDALGDWYDTFVSTHQYDPKRNVRLFKGHRIALNGRGGVATMPCTLNPRHLMDVIRDFCARMHKPLVANAAASGAGLPWLQGGAMALYAAKLMDPMRKLISEIQGAKPGAGKPAKRELVSKPGAGKPAKRRLMVEIAGMIVGAVGSSDDKVPLKFLMQAVLRYGRRLPVVVTVCRSLSGEEGLAYFVDGEEFTDRRLAVRAAHRVLFMTPLSKEEKKARRGLFPAARHVACRKPRFIASEVLERAGRAVL